MARSGSGHARLASANLSGKQVEREVYETDGPAKIVMASTRNSFRAAPRLAR